MRKTKISLVREACAALGKTEDDIAEALEKRRIKGELWSLDENPIAIYLKRKFKFIEYIEVDLYTIVIKVRRDDGKMDVHQIDNYNAVTAFLDNFNAWSYPKLEKESERNAEPA